ERGGPLPVEAARAHRGVDEVGIDLPEDQLARKRRRAAYRARRRGERSPDDHRDPGLPHPDQHADHRQAPGAVQELRIQGQSPNSLLKRALAILMTLACGPAFSQSIEPGEWEFNAVTTVTNS